MKILAFCLSLHPEALWKIRLTTHQEFLVIEFSILEEVLKFLQDPLCAILGKWTNTILKNFC